MKLLNIKNHLANAPKSTPRFSAKIKDKSGNEVVLGCPNATRALVALMNEHAVIGGAACHWGGPSAFAEMMSAIHGIMFKQSNWYNHFHFINDAGHAENGVYALRANLGFSDLTFESLWKFRSIESKLTGHGEAHLNADGVFISNGPLGSGLPQAQGLALADKLAKINRTTLCVLSDGAAMEGEARESFAAIPGLAGKGKLNPFVLIISDNNTKLGGRIDKDSYSMTPTFDSLETLGWKVYKNLNGHNLEEVYQNIEYAINEAKNNDMKPICLHFKTIKGYGVKSTVESSSGGHGFPLKAYDEKLVEFIQEIYQGNAPKEFVEYAQNILSSKPAPKEKTTEAVLKTKIQDGVASALIEAVELGFPVFSVSSDLAGSTGLKAFQTKFPDRTYDIGIAESNMVSTAIGLSKVGFIPVVDTFAQFGVTKGNLPLIMAGLSQGPVIAFFSHTGFQDAADGASHQATTYFSAVANIPHLKVISLSCRDEAHTLVLETVKKFAEKRAKGETPDSVVFFLGRENFPVNFGNKNFNWRKPQVLLEGSDCLIVATGASTQEAFDAGVELHKTGIKATVVNHAFLNSYDAADFKALLNKNKNQLVTIEDHQLQGGMGAYLTHSLKMIDCEFKLKSLGILGEFGQSAYTSNQLYVKHKISKSDVVSAVKSFF